MIRGLLDNFGWKIFSLAIAVLLWVAFVGSPELVTSVSVPIQYQNMPPDLEMSSDVPERVYLEIQGPSARMSSAELAGIAVVLDLAGVHKPGEQTVTIERQDIRLPPSLEVVRTIPGQLRLRFERRLEGTLPVRVRYAGPPPFGYRIVAQEVEPRTLRVIGPESRVKEVDYAETDPINLSQVVGKAEFRVHTFVRDPHVRLLSSPVVTVRITLEKNDRGEGAQNGTGALWD